MLELQSKRDDEKTSVYCTKGPFTPLSISLGGTEDAPTRPLLPLYQPPSLPPPPELSTRWYSQKALGAFDGLTEAIYLTTSQKRRSQEHDTPKFQDTTEMRGRQNARDEREDVEDEEEEQEEEDDIPRRMQISNNISQTS